MRSLDHGSTWSDFQRIDGDFVGYPCAVAVSGETNFVLYDSKDGGPHVLYASSDDGQSWTRRSTLPLDDDKWYGAMCLMPDGRILAGAYTEKDEHHFYYCISEDQGKTWSEQQRTYVDKMIRDPELAWLGGASTTCTDGRARRGRQPPFRPLPVRRRHRLGQRDHRQRRHPATPTATATTASSTGTTTRNRSS